jgi:hypothetical protein
LRCKDVGAKYPLSRKKNPMKNAWLTAIRKVKKSAEPGPVTGSL